MSHTADSSTRIGNRADDSRNVCAMAMLVSGVRSVLDEVPAINRSLRIFVMPHIGGDVGVTDIETRVDHGYHDVAASFFEFPGFHRADVSVAIRILDSPVFKCEKRQAGLGCLFGNCGGVAVEDAGVSAEAEG